MNYYQNKIMLFHLVQQMSREGKSVNWIADHFGISWRTTKRYINQSVDEFEHEFENPIPRKKHLDSYQGFVKDKQNHYPETSAAQMHDWLKEHHPDFPQVSPKTVFNFVQSVRIRFNIRKPESKREFGMIPELPYGRQAQVDFGFYTMRTSCGKQKKVQFFTMVLSRSRLKYVYFSDSPFTTSKVVEAHEKAFEFMGGIPIELVYDQDRLMFVDENLGDIIMTGEFKRYVGQRGFSIYLCRKADPQSKGKVENVVKYVKQNFLFNRSYRDLETLHDACIAWLRRTANEMVHNTTRLIPNEDHRLNEKQELQPWYSIVFEPRPESLVYSVHKDNKISYKGNFYSLPTGTYKDKNSLVKVVLDKGELIILAESGKEICRHQVSLLKGQKIIARNHTRDRSIRIDKMIDSLCIQFEEPEKVRGWLEQIRSDKKRYIRDNVQLLSELITELPAEIVSQSLDFVVANNLLNATDFKSYANSLLAIRSSGEEYDPKIIRLNPLSGKENPLADIEPQQSELESYNRLFQ
ncbi:IS21 family transposase [Sphingobacterium athyrii]|uniref:IS21 family transposase n=2 Tax=Sphingobacterium TaxID=28453 RepID=UPI0028B18C6E|nr:IS21 family transposase [Sphingobacterium athyrii]